MPGGRVAFSLDVVIPRIIELGLEEAPKEACGLVVPDLGVPADSWVIRMTNQAANPYDSYSIDATTIRGLLEERDVWDDVLVWHTHPGGHVGPSRGDMRARVEGIRYLVVSLPSGEATMF